MDSSRVMLNRSSKCATPRSIQHARCSRQSSSPAQSHYSSSPVNANSGIQQGHGSIVAVTTSDDQLCHSSVATQAPIGQAPQSYIQQQQQQLDGAKMQYSEVLVGTTNAKQQQGAVSAQPSSSLATQVEPSSSSINGYQIVRKCGVTDVATTAIPSARTEPRASHDTVALFIADLPYVQIGLSLDVLRSNLIDHLSSFAKIDNLTVRYGRLVRNHLPQGRQLVAFAFTPNLDEAKKLIQAELPVFMGSRIRVEISIPQRTLFLTTTRETVSLDRLRALPPWSSSRYRCPLLYRDRQINEDVVLDKVLAKELCSVFGFVRRLKSEKAPFEVIFADYEACRKARQVLGQLSAETGIGAYLSSEFAMSQITPRVTTFHRKSDVDLSSDCMPITTTSSSVAEPSPVEKTASKGVDSFAATSQGKSGDVAASMGPSIGIMANGNGNEPLKKGIADHYIGRPSQSIFSVDSTKKNETKQTHHRQREIDPHGIFVSRLPNIDNLEESLYSFFKQDGSIKHLRVMTSRSNFQSHFAFVTFEERESAQKALLRNNQSFMGKALNIRPKEFGHYFSQREHVPGPKTSLTVNLETAASNDGNIASDIAVRRVTNDCAVPSMTLRIESGTDSPEIAASQTMPFQSSSPNKQRGASLPSRPAQWSPNQDTWASTSARSSPCNLTTPLEGVPTEGKIQHRNSCGSDVYGPMIVPPMVQAQWSSCPPHSPLSISTQPTTAAHSPISPLQGFKLPPINDKCEQFHNDGSPVKHSGYRVDNGEQQACATANWMPVPGGMMMMAPPMMQNGEYNGPYWPMITVDPSGQRYVVHPINAYCPSMVAPAPGVPYSQQEFMHQRQGTAHEVNIKGNETLPSDKSPLGSRKDHERESAMTNLQHGPYIGLPPHFYPILPPVNPSLWTMQRGPIFDQTMSSPHGINRDGSHQCQRGSSIPGHGLNANVSPIQIPAWMNDSS